MSGMVSVRLELSLAVEKTEAPSLQAPSLPASDFFSSCAELPVSGADGEVVTVDGMDGGE